MLRPSADGGKTAGMEGLGEQIILLATVVATIAALPTLIEFLIERRKRKERIALDLDDLEVRGLDVRVAGFDAVIADVADLIDRVRHPEAYAGLKVGNEILIIGRSLGGKKALAQRIAKEAGLERLVVVYNPRNADALVRAKALVQRYRRQKVMLLLPRLDKAVEPGEENILAELDALIQTSSERRNVLVVGTAVRFASGDVGDNMFGIVLALPGTPLAERPGCELNDELRRLLTEVTRFYLGEAKAAGFALVGIGDDEVVERIVCAVNNPAEVEDIVALAQTTALHRRRTGQCPTLDIAGEIIERSMRRVIVVPA